ncbi:hypothetical protein ACN26Z_08240 [Verrucosispora sp. WMMD703]|uniref:hypothetical protein n=1 Tax=unclassified Micromonospora TaxID=2617518 RepID=UPI00249CBCAA|nr:hypothetical protein [Verrucosispora sp. WMMD1129]WFE44569.1 hypothetical protein O7624_09595 [Verrucosispora sp. WMMD1129]
MSGRAEFSDLIRAMARRGWGTVDQILDGLETTGWRGDSQTIVAATAIAVNEPFAAGHLPADNASSSPRRDRKGSLPDVA